LLCFGVIAKIGAWILSIPDCVLGGALTFLFANIMVSGIKLIGFDRIDRRTHYIVATSLALGVAWTALVRGYWSLIRRQLLKLTAMQTSESRMLPFTKNKGSMIK
jgi:xanthine/uracil permease